VEQISIGNWDLTKVWEEGEVRIYGPKINGKDMTKRFEQGR